MDIVLCVRGQADDVYSGLFAPLHIVAQTTPAAQRVFSDNPHGKPDIFGVFYSGFARSPMQ